VGEGLERVLPSEVAEGILYLTALAQFDSTASIASQRMEHRPSGAVDVLTLRCNTCDEQIQLECDVSSFF
jgi:hypothetical protein